MDEAVKIEGDVSNREERSRHQSSDNRSYIRVLSNTSRRGKKISIPTRFKTILTGEDRQRAFGSSSDRFNYSSSEEMSELPGPGSYSLYSETLWKDNKESMSRKGYGHMASITKRKTGQIRYANTGPGPASYSYIPDKSFDALSQSSTQSTRATLISRIKDQIKQKNEQTIRFKPPKRASLRNIGPGTYEVRQPSKIQNISEIPFKSRIEKLVNTTKKKHDLETPAVGTYHLDRSLIRPKPYLQLGPTRAFCKTVVPDNIKADDYDRVKRHIIEENVKKPKFELMGQMKEITPGPHDYDSLESFIGLKENKEFNVTERPYGGTSPKLEYKDSRKEYPGPGQYKQKSMFETEKYKVYNAVFISESTRPPLENLNAVDITAPFDPVMVPFREDFHCNEKRKWIPY